MTKTELKGAVPFNVKDEEIAKAGSSIFYDVIPYEMIYTKEELP